MNIWLAMILSYLIGSAVTVFLMSLMWAARSEPEPVDSEPELESSAQ